MNKRKKGQLSRARMSNPNSIATYGTEDHCREVAAKYQAVFDQQLPGLKVSWRLDGLPPLRELYAITDSETGLRNSWRVFPGTDEMLWVPIIVESTKEGRQKISEGDPDFLEMQRACINAT